MAAGPLPPAGRPSAAARCLGALAAGLTLVLGAAGGVSFETQFLRAGLAGAAFGVLGWLAGTALGFVATARPAAAPADESHAAGRGRVMDVLVEDDDGPDVRRN